MNLPNRRADVRTRLISVAAGVAVVLGLTTACAGSGDENGLVPLTVIFPDASPMVPGNVVKAAGVTVGTIEALRLQGGLAYVDTLVSRSVLPLHTDARAIITTKDVLGERYISLERGTPSAPIAQTPIVIPADHTSTVVDPEQVVNAFTDPVSAAFAGFFTTFGEGLSGQGPETAAAIKELGPSMRHTAVLSRLLSQQNQVLASLIDTTRPVVAELANRRGADLDHLVGAVTDTLSATADNNQALAQALQRLPGTLARARTTLGHVAGVSDAATPTLRSIRPLTDNLIDVDRELRDFSDSADPALNSLDPVLDRAKKMLDEARPVADDLRPFGNDFEHVADDLHEFSDKGLSLRFHNIMEFAKDWALSTTSYDALSHYFRASVPVTPVALGRTGAGMIPGAPQSPVPAVPGFTAPPRLTLPGNCPQSHNRTCDKHFDSPPEHYGGGPGFQQNPGAPQGTGSMKDSATGLSPTQENAMLDQVMGGH